MAAGAARTLSGVTVVALEQAVSAPLCTRHLADLGARVIKIERRGEGDYLRTLDTKMNGLCSHFVWANRGKESVCIDVKQPDGVALLQKLVAKADVFVQNLAPGATKRLGVDGPTALQRHPSLIACTISGYGQGGPYERKKAYDLLVQAETGLVDVTGTQDVPSKVGTPVADIASGMYAYSGILAALYKRAVSPTRAGSAFEVSMLDALGDWMGWIYNYSMYSGQTVKRSGAAHAAIQPYGPFAVGSDGQRIMLAVQSQREWRAFCEHVLELPQVAVDPLYVDATARVANKDQLQALVEQVFVKLTMAQVVERLERASIAYGEYRTVAGAIAHPQWAAQRHWGTVQSSVGSLRVLKPVVQLDDDTSNSDGLGAVPELGQHTRPVLQELLGLSAAQVHDLASRHVI